MVNTKAILINYYTSTNAKKWNLLGFGETSHNNKDKNAASVKRFKLFYDFCI